MGRRIIIVLAVVLAGLFVYCVWPTPYRYYYFTVEGSYQNTYPRLVRVNRITGKVSINPCGQSGNLSWISDFKPTK